MSEMMRNIGGGEPSGKAGKGEGTRRSARFLPLLALVGCAVLWSTGGLLIKTVSLSPIATAGSRSIIAAVFLLAVRGLPDFRGGFAFWSAAVANAATMLLFVVATRLTTAANAVLLQYTAPVWVVLFGWLLFRQRVLKADLAAVAVVMAGMALFFAEGFSFSSGPAASLGDVLAIVSGVTFGFQALFMSRMTKSSPISAVVAGNLLVFLVSIPFLVQKLPTASDLPPLLGLGVLQIGTAYLLYASAVRHLTPLEIILVPIIEPLLNPVLVFLFRGETPSLSACAGGALILVTVTVWCVFRDRLLKKAYPDSMAGPPV
jgi:drug/metabolite transporter (DMT)-like permease